MSGLTYNGPINPNPKDDEAGIIIYGYVPSLALAIVGVVTFVMALAINAYYIVRRRGHGIRSFHSLICVGAVSELEHRRKKQLSPAYGNGRVCRSDSFSQAAFRGWLICCTVLPHCSREYILKESSPVSPVGWLRYVLKCSPQAPVLFTAAIYLSLTLAVETFSSAGRILILSKRQLLACKQLITPFSAIILRLTLSVFITADVVTSMCHPACSPRSQHA